MLYRTLIILILCYSTSVKAGVYAGLNFGDSRDEVTRKLQASELIEQTVDSTFFGRTGLNGVFKCKNKLAGLKYSLYFAWSENGGLTEITLRSEELPANAYGTSIKQAWKQANQLFTQVYGAPKQDAKYPAPKDFLNHPILITHLWHRGERQSILIGPGIEKGRSFLTIRFINKKVPPVITP